jgi:hypothetical protein
MYSRKPDFAQAAVADAAFDRERPLSVVVEWAKKRRRKKLLKMLVHSSGRKLFGPNNKKVVIEHGVSGFIIKYAIHPLAASNIKRERN